MHFALPSGIGPGTLQEMSKASVAQLKHALQRFYPFFFFIFYGAFYIN